MSENRIAYASRTYDDYKNDLIELTRIYYPDIFDRLNDASIGSWLINILSDIGDNLNYHIDRTYQETNVDSASQLGSLLNIARTNGLKIPGKKSALCEVELSCEVPLPDSEARTGNMATFDPLYCPVIKRGTLFSSGTTTFELMNDVNFVEQFNQDGRSDRKIEPIRDSNNNITSYRLTKLAVVQAGQSKVFKTTVSASDIKPFYQIDIQDNNILGVESIIVKQGTNFSTTPLTAEFFVDEEDYMDLGGNKVSRFYEVDNLIDQYRYGYKTSEKNEKNEYYNPIWQQITEPVYTIDENGKKTETEYKVILQQCVKGQWKRLKNKFIVEYDDNWNIKITFGAGIKNQYGEIPSTKDEFTQYMMSRMAANDYMGVLPEAGSTIYVLYRVGGGEVSNVAEGTITNIIYMNYQMDGNCNDPQDARKQSNVRKSFRVTNPSPSYGGKDEPSEEEIRYMIKYAASSQNRCVTLHDYKVKLNQLPAKYGCPFRIGVIEENNKVCIYALGLNSQGKLYSPLAEPVAENMLSYLSNYKTLNDYIEIKSGKIINISFKLTVYVDKTYEKSEVVKRIIDEVYDYMDIRKNEMGQDIFLGDLQKKISQLDGVINLSDMRCYNKVGGKYSDDKIAQELADLTSCYYGDDYDGTNNDDNQIDLKSSDMILYGNANSMYEILDKTTDIIVEVKTR